MTEVVVDASVLVACAIANGKARRALFASVNTDFFAPALIRDELVRRVPKILALSVISPSVLSALLEDLFSRVTVIPLEGFAHRMAEAIELTTRANAQGDEDYVALALALNAPIWTYDRDFHRISGVRVIGREEIETARPG